MCCVAEYPPVKKFIALGTALDPPAVTNPTAETPLSSIVAGFP